MSNSHRADEPQLIVAQLAATAAPQPLARAQQLGAGHPSRASLSTGELCTQLGDRVARTARTGAPLRTRALLPTRSAPPVRSEAAPDPLHGLSTTVLQLLEDIESCDPAGPGRAHTVAQNAVAITGALLPAAELQRVRHAALLCNIGLAAVPRAILQKTDPLTPAERQLVRRHPICGAEILHDIPSLRELIPLVLHHHEAYDGNGYPYRLSGEWIPRGARVIRLAETYEALLRTQPYRPALASPDALVVLRAGAGEQFDPACVDALAAWLERGAPQDATLAQWWQSRQAPAR